MMPQRIAAAASLMAFAVCLVAGVFGAQNTYGTVVSRALGAMAVTFVVGMIVGAMAQRMLDEQLRREEEELMRQLEAAADAEREANLLRQPERAANPLANSVADAGFDPQSLPDLNEMPRRAPSTNGRGRPVAAVGRR